MFVYAFVKPIVCMRLNNKIIIIIIIIINFFMFTYGVSFWVGVS
jgi:hypothetical protein